MTIMHLASIFDTHRFLNVCYVDYDQYRAKCKNRAKFVCVGTMSVVHNTTRQGQHGSQATVNYCNVTTSHSEKASAVHRSIGLFVFIKITSHLR